MRILFQIIQLLLRHGWSAKAGLFRRELLLRVKFLEQVPDGILSLLVLVGLKKWTLRGKVPYVAIAFIPHGAKAKHCFVAAVSCAKNIAAWFGTVGPHEDFALHARRFGTASQAEHGGSQID